MTVFHQWPLTRNVLLLLVFVPSRRLRVVLAQTNSPKNSLPGWSNAAYEVHAYNRTYEGTPPAPHTYKGVNIISFRTVKRKGFDTLLHSLKATWHIIRHNTGDIVHIQNGGNSIWALPLRLAGKKVFISQDGIDWKRDKWPWYGKLYLYLSSFMTAYFPNRVIFDNVFVREFFEKKFGKKFDFIPFGSEVTTDMENSDILEKLDFNTR